MNVHFNKLIKIIWIILPDNTAIIIHNYRSEHSEECIAFTLVFSFSVTLFQVVKLLWSLVFAYDTSKNRFSIIHYTNEIWNQFWQFLNHLYRALKFWNLSKITQFDVETVYDVQIPQNQTSLLPSIPTHQP